MDKTSKQVFEVWAVGPQMDITLESCMASCETLEEALQVAQGVKTLIAEAPSARVIIRNAVREVG